MSRTSILIWHNRPQSVNESPAPSSSQLTPIYGSTKEISQSQLRKNNGQLTDEDTGLAGAFIFEDRNKYAISLELPASITTAILCRPLSTSIKLVPLDKAVLPQYQALNNSLFPIPYSRLFYDRIIDDPMISTVSWAAVDTSELSPGTNVPKVIGAIRCHLRPASAHDKFKKIMYISTIGTNKEYRAQGLAANLLRQAIITGEGFLRQSQEEQRKWGDKVGQPPRTIAYKVYKDKEITQTRHKETGSKSRLSPLITSISGHVWCRNTEALEFYSRLGFRQVSEIPNYYRSISPPHAIFIEMALG